jgi:DNA-binding protein HU-beta
MTKSELEVALTEATQMNKRTAGAFLNALAAIAYKAVKKEGEFLLPGFGKLVKQKRAARTGFNPQTRQKMKVVAKTVVRFRVAKGAKDAILGAKTPSQAGKGDRKRGQVRWALKTPQKGDGSVGLGVFPQKGQVGSALEKGQVRWSVAFPARIFKVAADGRGNETAG